jgi:hypothetical protein
MYVNTVSYQGHGHSVTTVVDVFMIGYHCACASTSFSAICSSLLHLSQGGCVVVYQLLRSMPPVKHCACASVRHLFFQSVCLNCVCREPGGRVCGVSIGAPHAASEILLSAASQHNEIRVGTCKN